MPLRVFKIIYILLLRKISNNKVALSKKLRSI